MNFKKSIAVIMSAVLVFCAMPLSVFAKTNNEAADITVDVNPITDNYSDSAAIELEAIVTNNSDAAYDVDIDFEASPMLKLVEGSFVFENVEPSEKIEFTVEAEAEHEHHSLLLLQILNDLLLGHIYTALFELYAIINGNYEYVKFRVHDIPAIVLYEVKATASDEEPTTQPATVPGTPAEPEHHPATPCAPAAA